MTRIEKLLRGIPVKERNALEKALKFYIDNNGSGGGDGGITVVFDEDQGTASVSIETIDETNRNGTPVKGRIAAESGAGNLALIYSSEIIAMFGAPSYSEDGFGLEIILGIANGGSDTWQHVTQVTSPMVVNVTNVVWDQTGTSGTGTFDATPAQIAAAANDGREIYALVDTSGEKDGHTERTVAKIPFAALDYYDGALSSVSFGGVQPGGSVDMLYSAVLPVAEAPTGTIKVRVVS